MCFRKGPIGQLIELLGFSSHLDYLTQGFAPQGKPYIEQAFEGAAGEAVIVFRM